MQICIPASLSHKVNVNPIGASFSTPASRGTQAQLQSTTGQSTWQRLTAQSSTRTSTSNQRGKTKVRVNERKFYSKILAKRKVDNTFSQTPTGHPTPHYTKSWFGIRSFATNLTGQTHPVSLLQVSAAEWWVFLKVKTKAPQGLKILNPAKTVLLPSQEL